MAPRAPTGRAAVLAWLRSPNAGVAPAWMALGGPTVRAGVVCEGGVWRIRETQMDHDGFGAFTRQLQAEGKPLFPEHGERYQRPTGKIFLEAVTLDGFIRALEAYEWPPNW